MSIRSVVGQDGKGRDGCRCGRPQRGSVRWLSRCWLLAAELSNSNHSPSLFFSLQPARCSSLFVTRRIRLHGRGTVNSTLAQPIRIDVRLLSTRLYLRLSTSRRWSWEDDRDRYSTGREQDGRGAPRSGQATLSWTQESTPRHKGRTGEHRLGALIRANRRITAVQSCLVFPIPLLLRSFPRLFASVSPQLCMATHGRSRTNPRVGIWRSAIQPTGWMALKVSGHRDRCSRRHPVGLSKPPIPAART